MSDAINGNSFGDQPHKMVDEELLYYIAGPMTGIPEYNYPAFTAACTVLRANGMKVVSPHEVPWPEDHETMDVEELWTEMMHRTNELLATVGGFILLPGWAHSRGALRELEVVRERKLPVLFLDWTGSVLARVS